MVYWKMSWLCHVPKVYALSRSYLVVFFGGGGILEILKNLCPNCALVALTYSVVLSPDSLDGAPRGHPAVPHRSGRDRHLL